MPPYTNRSLSYPSLKSVILRLETNIRFHLSLEYPSIRRIEKLVPLRIKNLQIDNTCLEVDTVSFRIAETEQVDDIEPFNRRWFQWESGPEDTPLLGDIHVPDFKLNRPLLSLKNRRVRYERLREDMHKDMEKRLREEPEKPGLSKEMTLENILSIECAFRGVLAKGKIYDESAPNPLALKYPLAHKELLAALAALEKYRQTEMFHYVVGCIASLKFVIYPQANLLIYNEYTIKRAEGEKYLYSCRLPEEVSRREAFKKMTTQFLGGREKSMIHIDNLELNVEHGIVGLPVGLKFNYTNLHISAQVPDNIFEAFKPLSENRFPGREIRLKYLPRDMGLLQSEQIKCFSRLYVDVVSAARANDLLELGNLHFKSIHINDAWRVSLTSVLTLVERWYRRDDLQVGMSFQIGFEPMVRVMHLIERFHKRVKDVTGVIGTLYEVVVPISDSNEFVLRGKSSKQYWDMDFIEMEVNKRGTAGIE